MICASCNNPILVSLTEPDFTVFDNKFLHKKCAEELGLVKQPKLTEFSK